MKPECKGVEEIDTKDFVDEIMSDIDRQYQEILEKAKKQPHFDIFIAKVNKYNDAKEYYSHYVHLKNGKLMVIDFRSHHWEFDVVELEEE